MTRYPGYTDEITDPEVLADLRKRDASERDRGRTRPLGWVPAPIVEHWGCKGCGALVGVTKEAVETREVFNARLRSRGEAELAKDRIVFCPSCKARDEDLARAQAEAKAAARKPHEQKPLELGDQAERPSGQRTNRRRKP